MNDIAIVLCTYGVVGIMQLIGWPMLYGLCHSLVDRGWALARVMVSIIISLIIWFVSYNHVPMNTQLGVNIIFFMLALTVSIYQKNNVLVMLRWVKSNKQIVIIQELLFAGGFFSLAYIRGFQPDILGLEKCMDFGFIKSYLISSTLPAQDMWFAGKSINYYSFGHFWASILMRLWHVVPEIGYNLVLAFILGSSLALCFSIIINMLCFEHKEDCFRANIFLFAGCIGSLLVNIGGNSHIIWYLLKEKTLKNYWYVNATRFIPYTIHEFPAYSYVVSDLHAHVLNLVFVFSFLIILIAWIKRSYFYHNSYVYNRYLLEILLGIILGCMIMVNTWDFLIYGLLLLLVSICLLITNYVSFIQLFISGCLMGVIALLIAFPWLYSFEPIAQGIAFVSERSSLRELCILWSGHIFITFLALIITFRLFSVSKRTTINSLVIALALTAFILIIIPEVIYAKDIYPLHPRANTMFKLTYQAFIMMSLLAGYVIGSLHKLPIRFVTRSIGLLFLLVLSTGFLIYPYYAFYDYYQGFNVYKGLDGLVWYKIRYPDEARIAKVLEKNYDHRSLVEAVGDSYSDYNMLSAFTGIPTIVGWRAHEWLWRGGYEKIAQREADVKSIYESDDKHTVRSLLSDYAIGWILVSDKERAIYNLHETMLQELGLIWYRVGSSYLIKVSK